SVVTLETTVELDNLYTLAVEAIQMEKEKHDRMALEKETGAAFSKIDGLEPQY
ncbi:MAG: cell division protein FtsZ, partial [Candidatus Methanomarinus sp.]